MAKPDRKRRGTDWDAARDFWLALDPPRSFEDVGRHFGISGQRVGQIARRDGWRDLGDEVDARALEQAKRRIVRSRADRVAKTLGIVDGLLDRYDEQLDQLELRPADLDRIVKLAELLEGQATDRMEFAEVQEALGVLLKIASRFVPRARLAEFLDEVRSAMGQLDGQAAAA